MLEKPADSVMSSDRQLKMTASLDRGVSMTIGVDSCQPLLDLKALVLEQGWNESKCGFASRS